METFAPRPVDMAVYGRNMRLFSWLLGLLGLSIRTHGDENLWQDGDIFLFNHFSRFETMVPPYFMYHKTGRVLHSVAHHSLYHVHRRMSDFMLNMGTLPTNAPGLMPYLAAQILKGNAMAIYPEGGIIRDKKVRQDNGEYAIHKYEDEGPRKMHRGAAALAQMLTLFKARLIQLEQRDDKARLERWRNALGFDTVENLLKAAHKPTRIVPCTFTFYPIRNAPTWLSRLMGLFMRPSPEMQDEVVSETNLLFRPTDLDLRLSDPIVLEPKLSRMESWLLDQTFTTKVTSLEELFALKDTAESWSDKLLAHYLQNRTDDLRDAYMPQLYAGLHVNIGHLVATLLLQRFDAGERQVDTATFKKALYLAIHALQDNPQVHRHDTLRDPVRYQGLLYDEPCPHLARVLQTAVASKLIRLGGKTITLLKGMGEIPHSRVTRLIHPLRVMANEAASIDAVVPAVAAAWKKAEEGETVTPDMFWKDELNAYYIARETTRQDLSLLAEENGAPYRLTPEKPHPVGVLLIHGFLSSPGQLKHLGQSLAASGHPVLGARIPGHGTNAWDLHRTDPACWLSGIRRQYDILAASCEKVVVLGFSTGGMLALRLAAQRPDKLAGVITVAVPYKITEKHIQFVPWANAVNRVFRLVTRRPHGVYPHISYPTGTPSINYSLAPVPAVNGLLQGIRHMQRELARVTAPTLILHADADPLCAPQSAKTVHAGLKNAVATLLYIQSRQHNIISHPTAEVLALVQGFIRASTHKKAR